MVFTTAGMLDDLFQLIREEAGAATWSRGVELAREGRVVGLRENATEIEVRVQPRLPGEPSPAVTLMPEDEDWSCECTSGDPVCPHVAAGIIAVRQAKRGGQPFPGAGDSPSKAARIAYRLHREDGALALERVKARGPEGEPGREEPLTTSLVAAQNAGEDLVVSQQDLQIQVALGTFTRGRLPRERVRPILEALTDLPDLRFEGEPAQIGAPSSGICLVVEDAADGFRARLTSDPTVDAVFDNGALRRGQTLCPIDHPGLGERELAELKEGRLFTAGDVGELVGDVLPRLEKKLPVRVQSTKLPGRERVEARVELRTERTDDALSVLPLLVYGDPPVARVDGDELRALRDDRVPQRTPRRERKLRDWLRDTLGLAPGVRVRVQGEDAITLAETLERLEPNRATVRGDAHRSFFRAGTLQPKLDLRGDAGEYDLGFEALGRATSSGGGGRADPEAVLRAWDAGESLVPLTGGGFAELPADWMQRFGRQVRDLLAARKSLEREGVARGGKVLLVDLAHLAEDLNVPLPPPTERLQRALDDFTGLGEPDLPADLAATLRDYQRDGVAWLQFLRRAGLGALLADDMGLGKTVQALATFERDTLVVAPRSVLHNWEAEARKFRPSLSVNVYHGPDRALDDAELTLTTYAILRLDNDVLSARPWDCVVLDEAQAIKNPSSQVSRAAFRLQAEHRVALTGTPVENRLEDLWSQFHFLNRGLLGGRQDFHERYSKPIQNGEEEVAAHLRRRVRPFILRRTKDAVAKELPPRTDVTLYCELDERERRSYDAVRAATRGEIAERLEAGEDTLAVLEALLRLRQAACDPALLPGADPEAGAAVSSKVQLLVDTLEEVVSEQHKALVFSQWTSLLDRIEPSLRRTSIDFTRLDGSTRDRQGVVDRFQDAEGPPVLLISLKAGGTGLNLTAADHVFLMDPWWNPAVEDQAADRAHRIGQQRPVFVHRLVAEKTVEEQIVALQLRKRELADAAVASGSAGLTREDLMMLLG